MAREIFTIDDPQDKNYMKQDDVVSSPVTTAEMRLTGQITVQIAGSATAINATVLRSPDGAADNYSPAGDAISGDPSVGINIKRYTEPTVGFWKVRVNSISGTAKIHISGRKVS